MTWFIGTVVRWNGTKWTVQENVDDKTVRLVKVGGKKVRLVPSREVTSDAYAASPPPALVASQQDWDDALEIMKCIEPLAKNPRNTLADIRAVAAQLDCSVPSVYNYLKTWLKHQQVSAFLRKPRSDRGSTRLEPRVVAVIGEVVTSKFLKEERPDVAYAVEEVRRLCKARELPMPSPTPVIRAIARLSAKETARARLGPKHARERFEPYKGSFPGADHPLDVFQIDHTPADVILIDEEYGLPIGRSYLTIVLDVCTRMIVGFLISLERPGALATALALSHAILPKEDWCRSRGIDVEWPIWGIPRKVFADNAKEFRGTAITRGCENNNIDLENRPKGLPQYGGHVERAFRTFMRRTQGIKGSTFSNVAKKRDYNSQGKAILTLKDYENWFARFILYRYHHKYHSGIGYPPINLYKKLIEGDERTAGIGAPAPILDGRRLLLDFLPFQWRTIQQRGVELNGVWYWSDVMQRLTNEKNIHAPDHGGKYVFAYDPRDLSIIYFLDQTINEYFPVPCKDRARPPRSIWELKASNKRIKLDPARHTNEDMVFEGAAQMESIEEAAAATKASVRRMRARRKDWAVVQKAGKAATKGTSKPAAPMTDSKKPSSTTVDAWGDDDEVVDFSHDDPT